MLNFRNFDKVKFEGQRVILFHDVETAYSFANGCFQFSEYGDYKDGDILYLPELGIVAVGKTYPVAVTVKSSDEDSPSECFHKYNDNWDDVNQLKPWFAVKFAIAKGLKVDAGAFRNSESSRNKILNLDSIEDIEEAERLNELDNFFFKQ